MTVGKSPCDKRCKAFTLLELIVTVSLLAIITIVAISRLREAKRGRTIAINEATAIANLRTLSSAEELYNTREGSYGTFKELENMFSEWRYWDDPMGSLGFIHATSPDKAVAGYFYTLNLTNGDWCCVARPSAWGSTGTRNFRIDQTGAIYYNRTKDSNEFNWATGI